MSGWRVSGGRWGAIAVLLLAIGAVASALAATSLGHVSRPSLTTTTPTGSVAATPPTTTRTTTTTTTTTTMVPPSERTLELVDVIGGDIAAKSVVVTPTGQVFAQNMMYRHSVTVYGPGHDLVATIDDGVDLSDFGIDGGSVRGAPVEAAATSDGRWVYVSNYALYGEAFDRVGDDDCDVEDGFDESVVYRVDATRLAIDQVIAVGSVPKYLAVTPDDRYVLVTNWCTFDLSVVDVARGVEVRRIPLGRHPRGIAVDPASERAYVTVMGGSDLAVVDLGTFEVEWLRDVGDGPRHVVLSPDGGTLYVSLNREATVRKIDIASGEVVGEVTTGVAPRSMVLSPDGGALYVVNYGSDTMTKVLTEGFEVDERVATGVRPIGIAYHPLTHELWVSNYGSGTIQVFADRVDA